MSDIKKYDKLVRDKIPKIIEKTGKICRFKIADKEEYRAKLVEKLLEEALEFVENPCVDELADVQQIIDSLQVEYGWSQLKAVVDYKKITRGGFREKIILEEVEG